MGGSGRGIRTIQLDCVEASFAGQTKPEMQTFSQRITTTVATVVAEIVCRITAGQFS